MSEESEQQKYPFSRCSSAGSIHTVTSSANNSDDEDSDLGSSGYGTAGSSGNNLKDKRRVAHTQAEQKRRDSIKKGYDALQELVPMRQGNESQSKISKATVLQKSIDYMQFLQNAKKKQEDELASLNKEAVAMTILKLNYDNIVAAHNNSEPGRADRQVSDQVKFQVFRAVLDSLFQTFEPSIVTTNFAEVSGSVISWLEEHCQPQILREIMCGVLHQLQNLEQTNNVAGGSSLPPSNTPPTAPTFHSNTAGFSSRYPHEQGVSAPSMGGMEHDGSNLTGVHKVERYY